jgi:hypothetical protein
MSGARHKVFRDIISDSARNRDRAPRLRRAFAIERQSHHHAGALAWPTLGFKLAAMEIDEPFDD